MKTRTDKKSHAKIKKNNEKEQNQKKNEHIRDFSRG